MSTPDPIEFMIKDWAKKITDYEQLGTRKRNEAKTAQEIADGCDVLVRTYRQFLGQLTGQAVPLTRLDVRAGETDLGLGVGPVVYAPPADASDQEITEFAESMDRLAIAAIHQRGLAQDEQGRRWRMTERTGELLPEDLAAALQPQGPVEPDPLTAAPSEDSGPHPVLPAAPAWPDMLGQRLALDIGETEPMVGRLTAVDPERLTIQMDQGAHAGETVWVDIAGVADWQALPELPPEPAAVELKPAGYPEQPAVAPPLPRRERKADPTPTPLNPVAADACGQVLEALRADEPDAGQPERLIDPDCRDGKCGSCVGGPCQHECHNVQPEEATGGEAAVGRFQPADGAAGSDRAGAVDDGQRAGADGPAPGAAQVNADEQSGDDQ